MQVGEEHQDMQQPQAQGSQAVAQGNIWPQDAHQSMQGMATSEQHAAEQAGVDGGEAAGAESWSMDGGPSQVDAMAQSDFAPHVFGLAAQVTQVSLDLDLPQVSYSVSCHWSRVLHWHACMHTLRTRAHVCR